MKKVTCCIPLTWGYVPFDFTLSLFGMQKYGIGKYDMGIAMFGCAYLDKTRDELAESALKESPDYILYLDVDQTYPVDTIEILMSHIDEGKQVVGGITPHKGNGEPLVYKIIHTSGLIKQDPTTKPFTGLHKVEVMGFGGIMIDPKVFDTIEFPRFQAGWNWPTHIYVGEDTKFYQNCKKHGIEVWCDTDLPFGHIQVKSLEFDKSAYTNQIDGWMKDKELVWLYEMASKMENVVEIGSWKGRSTHALLSGCPGTVWAVDHFLGSEAAPKYAFAEAKVGDIHKVFLKNVGHFKNLKVLKTDSIKASKKFADKSVDMVFVDGDHEYESVKADIGAWLPKAKKFICGHDYSFSGVKKAVDELLGEVFTHEEIWSKEIF